ncbi:MAG: ATP-grasp domain-containing protein [Candidatus Bathyarchaeia archaeon]
MLVTGAGGIGGNNFVRALRLAEKQLGKKLFIVGTDHNPHYLQMAMLDERFITPRHDDPTFISTLLKLIKKHKIRFLHPHPSSEARLVSGSTALFKKAGVRTYLPRLSSIAPDKLKIFEVLSRHEVSTPKTVAVKSERDVEFAFSKFGRPLWVRAKSGAGGRLGLKVNCLEEAKLWMQLNALQGRAKLEDFIIQEYLPGRDLAFDSLWFRGKLVTSYARERLEYPLKHVSLSGITGTPSVARIIRDEEVNRVGVNAVKALDDEPHGFFSVDMKCDREGKPVVTEVDGKWHTTAALWGYAFAKAFRKPEYNVAYLYLELGLFDKLDVSVPLADFFPCDCYLVRQMDAGVILKCDDKVWQIA